MAHEAARYERVLGAPDEHRLSLQLLQAGPEALLAVGLVHIDVARALVEGESSRGRQIGTQELVDAGGGPTRLAAVDQPADDRLDGPARGRLQVAEPR